METSPAFAKTSSRVGTMAETRYILWSRVTWDSLHKYLPPLTLTRWVDCVEPNSDFFRCEHRLSLYLSLRTNRTDVLCIMCSNLAEDNPWMIPAYAKFYPHSTILYPWRALTCYWAVIAEISPFQRCILYLLSVLCSFRCTSICRSLPFQFLGTKAQEFP